ncbi:MAG: hypothetical protein GY754_31395 [bacterium]|nr:hypothetical protein [bacterium]
MKDICSYTPQDEDLQIDNPYLAEIEELKAGIAARGGDLSTELYRHRESLVSQYSFSIPTIESLKILARYSPIVEIGAGNGYWAYCLNELKVDIIPFDKYPPEEALPWPWGSMEDKNFWYDSEWFPVSEGDEEMAAFHAKRTLLLCWPPFHTPMASHTLEAYTRAGGKTLVYIGDRLSSGDAAFHETLDSLKVLEKIKIPGWPGTNDYLTVYLIN